MKTLATKNGMTPMKSLPQVPDRDESLSETAACPGIGRKSREKHSNFAARMGTSASPGCLQDGQAKTRPPKESEFGERPRQSTLVMLKSSYANATAQFMH